MNAPANEPRKRLGMEALAVVMLLAAHLGLLIHCATAKSICYDEGAHVAAGMAYLRYGEFSIYNLSPPLMRMAGVLPAYMLCEVEVPVARPMLSLAAGTRAWAYYDLFQAANLDRLHGIVIAARMTVLPISLLGAILVWQVARRLYGAAGGLTAMAVWAFSPTILASGSTFGTDMPLAVGMMLAVAAWIAFLRGPTPGRCLLAAMAVAAVHLVKFNAVLIFPALVALSTILPRGAKSWRSRLMESVTGLLLASILSYIALCGAFGFRLMFEPNRSFEPVSSTMQRVQQILPAEFPMPFPRYLVEGFDVQKWEAESTYYNSLFGEGYFGSDWRYFPLHVFCKATIGELALASVGVLSLLWRGPSRLEWCWASAGAILVGGMLLLTDINIGGPRYLLYAYPIAFVLLGRTSGGCASVAGMRVARSFFALAAITSAVESVVSAPRYHSFYNIAARGLQFDVPESDWGQDLVALREWLAEQPIGVRDRIAVMTSAPTWAEAYDLRALELRNVARTRYVAVGRQFLTGLPRRHRGEYCMLRNWRALQLQPAIADLGGMLIFESHQLQPLQGPAVLIVESWEQALADPLLPTMRNLDQRKQQGR